MNLLKHCKDLYSFPHRGNLWQVTLASQRSKVLNEARSQCNPLVKCKQGSPHVFTPKQFTMLPDRQGIDFRLSRISDGQLKMCCEAKGARCPLLTLALTPSQQKAQEATNPAETPKRLPPETIPPHNLSCHVRAEGERRSQITKGPHEIYISSRSSQLINYNFIDLINYNIQSPESDFLRHRLQSSFQGGAANGPCHKAADGKTSSFARATLRPSEGSI